MGWTSWPACWCCTSSGSRASDQALGAEAEPPGLQPGREKDHNVTKYERDDVDWATAAEQSSEVDEVQEGLSSEHDEESVDPAEQRAVHVVDDEGNDVDLDAVLDAMAEAS